MDFHQKYRRVRSKVINFKIKDVSTRTLLLTAGALAAIVVIPTTLSFLPQPISNQNQDQSIPVRTTATFGLNNPKTCSTAEKNGTLYEPRCEEWLCTSDNYATRFTAPYTIYKHDTGITEVCGGCTKTETGVSCTNNSSPTNACNTDSDCTTFGDYSCVKNGSGDSGSLCRANHGITNGGYCIRPDGSLNDNVCASGLYCNPSSGNCSPGTSSNPPSNGGSNPPSTGGGTTGGSIKPPGTVTCPAGPNSNRASCDAIRGTTYCSDAERSFYLGSCVTSGGGGGNPVPISTAPVQPPAQPPATSGGGSGANCTPGSATVSSQCSGTDIAPGGGTIYQYPSDYDNSPTSVGDCKFACDHDSNCRSWVYVPGGAAGSYGGAPTCYEKGVTGPVVANSSTTAGIKGSGTSSGGGTTTNPPANTGGVPSTCTGDSKVWCAGQNQCYGVVAASAGGCKNWVCQTTGGPKCADISAPGTATGGTNPPASNGGNTGGTGISCATACQNASPAGAYCGSGNAVNNQCSCTLCSVQSTPVAKITPNATVGGNPVTKTISAVGNSASVPTATNTPASNQTQATNTPSAQATSTPAANSAIIALSLNIPGVGTNTASGKNNNPSPSSRSVEIQVVDTAGTTKSTSGQLTYDTASGNFKGNVSIAGLTSGTYTVKARFNNSLWKAIKGLALSPNQTTNAPATELTTGDINQDNLLNLIDYNLLISCFGSKTCSYKTQSDLNMDGKVNEADLNILYSLFTIRNGE